MKCIIIDDEFTAREILAQLCSKVKTLELVSSFANAIEAIKFLNTNNNIDLIFLDIHMPTFSGFDFINTLKITPHIILTTSDRNLALDAFEYDCIVDYLTKPITKERFLKAVNKASKTSVVAPKTVANSTGSEISNDLFVNINRRLVKINIPDIYLIEAKGDYINIKTEKTTHIVHSTLKKIENKLPISTFLKVHRSFIINIRKIIDIEDNSVLIKKDVIPVSRSNRPELMKRLNLL